MIFVFVLYIQPYTKLFGFSTRTHTTMFQATSQLHTSPSYVFDVCTCTQAQLAKRKKETPHTTHWKQIVWTWWWYVIQEQPHSNHGLHYKHEHDHGSHHPIQYIATETLQNVWLLSPPHRFELFRALSGTTKFTNTITISRTHTTLRIYDITHSLTAPTKLNLYHGRETQTTLCSPS